VTTWSLYTDGITDASWQGVEFLGVDCLREAVCHAGPVGAQALCDQLFAQVDRFQAGAAQCDYMAVLIVLTGE